MSEKILNKEQEKEPTPLWMEILLSSIFILGITIGVIIMINIFKHGWRYFFTFVGETTDIYLNCILIGLSFIALVFILNSFQMLLGRWRKIRVFISYQHKHEELVKQLQQKLKNRWLNVRYLPYEEGIEHDALLWNVDNEIIPCNVVIVLPGTDESFVSSEIASARTLRKIIIFLKLNADQKTPNTAFKGYVIFDMDKLANQNFTPLIRFMFYTNRLWKDIFLNFPRLAVGSIIDFFIVYFIYGIIGSVIFSAIFLISLLIFGFSMEHLLNLSKYSYWALTAILCSIFGYRYIKTILQRLKSIKVARQKILSGEFTYEYLEEALSYLKRDEMILKSIHQGCLPIRHEKPTPQSAKANG